ncbi:MAG: [protein-PII] uridylyltransferase, partial [Dermatophilaceae bacterium]
MATSSGGIGSRRLDLAGTRDFAVAGAGRSRREAISAFNRSWLGDVWRDATGGSPPGGVALAAVGSLGRADAGPLSDYDLVLLHSERSLPAKELVALADRVWYPIWDAGVRLDHAVRTVGQCRQVAASDLTAAVGLLDLVAVAGDEELVAAARATVAHDWRGNARKRLPQLVEAMSSRHQRQGDLAQSLEPELKEAHGGLRDMTVLAALAEAWLADRPHGGVDAAHELLLDVRDAVHVVTGRGRDRLARDDHDSVAALLGYDDADELLTAVSTAGRLVAYSLDGTLRRAGQSQRARTLRVGPRRPQMTPLGHGLFASDGEVVLGAARLAESDAGMPFRAAVVAARAGLPVAPATLDNLAHNAPPLPVPWTPVLRDLLGDLLASGPGLVTVWEGLDQVGIVDTWLPEWSAVRSRPQRSAVHRHTVDRHLVETVVRAAGLVRRVSRP